MSAIGMPSHLLAFFAPRPPLEPAPQRGRRQRRPYDGIASLLHQFEKETPPPPPPFVSPQERRIRLKEAREKEHREIQMRRRALYDPHVDPEKKRTAECRKTLFVGRLSYETTEKKLLKTFEPYGQIRDIRVVCDLQNKPRGYAFIEFKTEEGMWNAYKNANQKVIDGRTILVDSEKARLVAGWLPRRLGGGEGPPRKGVAPLRTRVVLEPTPRFSRGGGPGRGTSRGGHRGSMGGPPSSRGGMPPRYSSTRGQSVVKRGGPYERYGDAPPAREYNRSSDYNSRYYH